MTVAPRSGEDLFSPFPYQYGFGARLGLWLRLLFRSSNTWGAIPLITCRGVGLKLAMASVVVVYTFEGCCEDDPASRFIPLSECDEIKLPLPLLFVLLLLSCRYSGSWGLSGKGNAVACAESSTSDIPAGQMKKVCVGSWRKRLAVVVGTDFVGVQSKGYTG